MNQLSQTIQSTASASEELSSTSEEMSAQALRLQEAIQFFNTGANSEIHPPHVVPKRAKSPSPPKRIPIGRKIPMASIDDSNFNRF